MERSFARRAGPISSPRADGTETAAYSVISNSAVEEHLGTPGASVVHHHHHHHHYHHYPGRASPRRPASRRASPFRAASRLRSRLSPSPRRAPSVRRSPSSSSSLERSFRRSQPRQAQVPASPGDRRVCSSLRVGTSFSPSHIPGLPTYEEAIAESLPRGIPAEGRRITPLASDPAPPSYCSTPLRPRSSVAADVERILGEASHIFEEVPTVLDLPPRISSVSSLGSLPVSLPRLASISDSDASFRSDSSYIPERVNSARRSVELLLRSEIYDIVAGGILGDPAWSTLEERFLDEACGSATEFRVLFHFAFRCWPEAGFDRICEEVLRH